MNDWQKQIILGSLLGNGYIVKPKQGNNPFFGLTAGDNEKWFAYKISEISNLGTNKALYDNGKRWRSRCSEEWKELQKLCYKNGKKHIKMEWLDLLRDIALVIWFGDKGRFISNNKIALNTYAFGLQGNRIIEQYFNEVDMPCEFKCIRETGKIVFTNEGTREFFRITGHLMPNYILHSPE